jgi:hypothetical protein
LLAAGALIAGLLAAATPAMAAGRPNFTFSACWTGSAVSATMTWSGFRVSSYDFGYGQLNGEGAGYINPVDPAAMTGDVTIDPVFAANIDNTVDLVGGDIFGKNTRRALASGTVDRPAGGWSALPSC